MAKARASKKVGKKRGPKTAAGKARSLANLKPCKKGQVLNPKGRPPNIRFMSESLRDLLKKKAHEFHVTAEYCKENELDASQYTVFEVLAMRHIEHTFAGNGQFMSALFDRVEGKLIERLEARFEEKRSTSDMIDEFLGSEEEGDE